MKELLKKIIEKAGGLENLDLSEESIRKVSKELGISDSEVDEMLKNFDGFPLDEANLGEIAGGLGFDLPPSFNLGMLGGRNGAMINGIEY